MACQLRKACCCLSLRTGSLILGWLCLIINILTIGYFSTALSLIDDDIPDVHVLRVAMYASIGFCSFVAISAGCLIYGILKHKPAFFWPYLISTIVLILGNIAIFIAAVATLPFSSVRFMASQVTVGLGFYIYFFMIVLSYYKEMRSEQSERD